MPAPARAAKPARDQRVAHLHHRARLDSAKIVVTRTRFDWLPHRDCQNSFSQYVDGRVSIDALHHAYRRYSDIRIPPARTSVKIKDRQEFKSKPPPFSLHADDPVAAAVSVMAEKNIGSVVIVDDDRRVRGIVTERDLLRRLLRENLDQKTTSLSAIMTSEVKTAREDDEVIDWLRLMSNERFRHLPVVDGEGKLVNVLSQGDFVSYTWPSLLLIVKDKAAETFLGNKSQLTFMVLGVMLYSILMVVIFKFI
jgi:CBS domain-containing protein